MAKLAIKGHPTRGKEVIETLEMLGGNNKYHINIAEWNLLYTLREGDNVIIATYPNSSISQIFTLEEFLEKFPYKVGDKVRIPDYESEVRIDSMSWDGYEIQYQVFTDETEWYSAEELNKYNEIYKKETMEKEISGAIVDRFICLEGYDFYDDKGNIIDTKEITMKKKQPKYPKTFVECAKILNCFCAAHIDGYYCGLLENLQALLICRDAYWKIAENWKPDVMYCDLYCIGYDGNVITWKMQGGCRLLVFPTEEMRDAFYENFKELIEECKELL